jgi:hypothetical protein
MIADGRIFDDAIPENGIFEPGFRARDWVKPISQRPLARSAGAEPMRNSRMQ